MRLAVMALIGLLLLDVSFRGNIGSMLASFIAPDKMVDF